MGLVSETDEELRNNMNRVKKILGLMSAIFQFFTFSLVLTLFQCQNFKCLLSDCLCFVLLSLIHVYNF